MKKSRLADEQAFGFLHQLEDGIPAKPPSGKHCVSDATFRKDRRLPGGWT